MIIQIRGTSGSGKSTVMRMIKDALNTQPLYREKRSRPLYYQSGKTAILGHYESPCGGCDTIGSAKAVYDLIQGLNHSRLYDHILCEGLLLSEDTKWTSQLASQNDVRVVYLNTPLETCLRQIEQRRKAAGNDKPLNPSNTTNRVRVIERSRVKLTGLGVKCYTLAPSQVSRTVFRWFGI